MAIFKPFKAFRPNPYIAEKVAALPYDVMDSEEARKMACGNPYSFLHVDKAEIDLDPSIDLYDKRVYEKARENLNKMIYDKVLIQDDDENFYIYRQTMNGRKQMGLVGVASIDDYINDVIKKHEFTRADKEKDRINHVDYTNANTGPIFLAYRSNQEINNILQNWIDYNKPVYDFVSEDNIGHTVWVIDNRDIINRISKLFASIDSLYIADGHHRSASAVKVGIKRRNESPDYDGTEEFNFFLSVLFPDDQLYIMDYNRVIKDLNGNSESEFMNKVSEKFDLECHRDNGPFKPTEKHTFGMYLNKKWYKLKVKDGIFNPEDPVDRLDTSILQNNLLNPILGIDDPRTDGRIDFVGGIRGIKELERRVEEGMAVAFSMYPTSTQDLMAIADAKEVMPPKSTWFEPKLRSGLFIHKLG